MNEKWFSKGVSDIEKILKTNAASGLSPKAARSRYARQRKNNGQLLLTPQKSLGHMIGEVMADFSLILLIIASVIALFFDEYTTGLTGVLILVVNLVVCVVLYYRTQRLFEAFSQFFMPSATVIRGGKPYCVAGDRVVVGDVVLLSRGDIPVFDGRIVTSDALRVRVRVDRDRYEESDKFSDGAVRDRENDVLKMVNMVHAGSEVLTGSARVIVTETGRYTYLGARTGGIRMTNPQRPPEGLRMLRKYCTAFSMTVTALLLPFSLICLLFSHGDITLLTTFTSVLAVAASSMSQLACTVCRIFFERQARRSLTSANPSAVRSASVMDRLSDIDYLFLLDGSGVSDGVLHLDRAVSAEGELGSFTKMSPAATFFAELVSQYATAETNAMTTGLRAPGRYENGLREFLHLTKTDAEALRIRCPLNGYVPGNSNDMTDKVFFTEDGVRYILSVSQDASMLHRCARVYLAGISMAFSPIAKEGLLRDCERAESEGKQYLIFSLSTVMDGDGDENRCFAGILFFSEKTDPISLQSIQGLRRMGIRVISFANRGEQPASPRLDRTVSVEDFRDHRVPVTYKFGSFSTYMGLSDDEIVSLIEQAHKEEKKVAVMGFDRVSHEILRRADVFVSCAVLHHRFIGRLEEAVETVEVAGEATGSNCTQVLKSHADMIVPRPKEGKGGMASVLRAIRGACAAYHNLNGFFRYMLATQLARLCTVLLPMLFTEAPLDMRHLLFCGFVIDLFVMLIFATDGGGGSDSADCLLRHREEFSYPLSQNAGLCAASVSGALVALLLPNLIGRIGFMGQYFCNTEYSFLSLIWIHLSVVFCLRWRRIRNGKTMGVNRFAVALPVFCGVFLLLCFLIQPIGVLFNLLSLPFGYLLLTLVPPAVCVGIYAWIGNASLVRKK